MAVGATAVAMALGISIAVACGGSSAAQSPDEAPLLDTSVVKQLLEQAMADVSRLAASPPALELPPDVASLLEQTGIQIPAVPTNAAEICAALGTPGLAGATGGGLSFVLESFASGGEVGLAAALLTTAVFSACPAWSPHVETLLEDLARSLR